MTLKSTLAGILSAASIFFAGYAGADNTARNRNEEPFYNLIEDVKKITYDNYEKAKQNKGLSYKGLEAKLNEKFTEYSIGLIRTNERYFIPKHYYFNFYNSEDYKMPCVELAAIDENWYVGKKNKFIHLFLDVYLLKDYKILGCEAYRKGIDSVSEITLGYPITDVLVNQESYRRKIKNMWDVAKNNIGDGTLTERQKLVMELRKVVIKHNFEDELNEGWNDFDKFYEAVAPRLINGTGIPNAVGRIYARTKVKNKKSVNEGTMANLFELAECDLSTECLNKVEYLASTDANLRKEGEILFNAVIQYILEQQKNDKLLKIRIYGDSLEEKIQDLWKLNQDEIREIGKALLEKHLKQK